ncbi:MAG TPA: amidohydrolase family protein, partial [Flavisolibacter sp.]|nr:amidohydrolase family protein [Flavisolibacter sp.]
MMVRKIKAEKLFDGFGFVEDTILVVADGGTIKDLINSGDGGSDVEIYEGIISPGFINCHCHLELSHMRSRIPEKTGLVDFVFKVVTERHLPKNEVEEAIQVAEAEMILNGIVAVGDICNNDSTFQQKSKHHIRYYNFIEASGWLPSVSEARFQHALHVYTLFNALNQPASIVPHAPYSVSNNLWEKLRPYFKNKVACMHNQETEDED